MPQSLQHGADPPEPVSAPSVPQPSAPTPRRRWRSRLKKLAFLIVVLAILAGGGMVGAEYYTARPEFCGQCHVMDPYFKSWSRDEHSYKHGARCVDCHYAPGEQHTLKAKFKGLSQLTSYFSGRYGTARPRAHVKDASCMTAPCHGDRKFFTKSLLIGEQRMEKRYVVGKETEVQRSPTVRFVHEKHLQIEDKLDENKAQLAAVRGRLEASAGESFLLIQSAARSILPAADRLTNMQKTMKELGLEAQTDDALELMRLEHLGTRFRQLSGITCAACHGYDPSGERHVQTANLQACYTCHFDGQAFNRDTGECLKCHEPPVRQVLIHQQAGTLSLLPPTTASSDLSGKPVLMDHRDFVSRKIDCASCHFDVIEGEAVVSATECTHCHDQQKYLDDFEKRTTETVAEYHKQHVAARRAQCMDCHRAIKHRLINPMSIADKPDYLAPVLNECRHCHPGHHAEQVELLAGIGGQGVSGTMPNAMFGSRINCRACHTKAAKDQKGDELIKATEATCIACHGNDYERLFQQWQNEIETYLKETEESLDRVEAMIDDWQKRGATVPASATVAVEEARANVSFIRAGNGIHNKSYTLKLLDVSISKLDEAAAKLVPQ